MSHGGSGKQARAVLDGLQADVVTLALAYDIDVLADRGLVKPGWQARLPHNSTPYTSTIVFLVRPGNPKKILDWTDLARPGISVVTPEPEDLRRRAMELPGGLGLGPEGRKGGGGGPRRSWPGSSATSPSSTPAPAAPRRRSSSAASATSSSPGRTRRYLALAETGKGRVEIVVPKTSILAEPPVAVVDAVVDRRGTRAVAEAYLRFLYSPEGQQLAAKHHYRPRAPEAAAKAGRAFPAVATFTVDELFGGWRAAQKKHFDDGGIFDSFFVNR